MLYGRIKNPFEAKKQKKTLDCLVLCGKQVFTSSINPQFTKQGVQQMDTLIFTVLSSFFLLSPLTDCRCLLVVVHSFDSAFLLPDTTVSGMSTVLQYKLVPPIGQVLIIRSRVKRRNCVEVFLYIRFYNLVLKHWHYLVNC